MEFKYNDGGRALAKFKGYTGDCVVRSIAIATGLPYRQVYDDINNLSKQLGGFRRVKTVYGTKFIKSSDSRTGVKKIIYEKYLNSLGWKWVPTMGIGTGCKIHLKTDELPKSIIIVRLSRHLAAVINGVLNDTYDCSRGGTRCVYGYYIKG